jgi:peptidase E
MTKYILHGGETKVRNIHNRNFFREMVKGLNSPVKILDITFARKKKLWLEGYNKDKKKFLKAIKHKKLIFTLAKEKPEILSRQIKSNEVIFIVGGSEMRYLVKELAKIKNLKRILKGKVVAGSSAGAYVLSRYYYTRLRGRVEKGLGILPIKTIAHYHKAKSADHLQHLKNTGNKLKIYKIPETQYVVINTDI